MILGMYAKEANIESNKWNQSSNIHGVNDLILNVSSIAGCSENK